MRCSCSILALGLGLALLGGCFPSEEGAQTPLEAAPDFAHPDLEGNEVRLSELRGKTVVIDFWATWCAPCVYQPAEFNAFLEAYEGDDVVVLGVEIGGATEEEVRSWIDDNDAVARYPILIGADETLPHHYGVMGYPAMVVVNRAGEIASIHLGVSEAEAVEDAVTAARS